MKIAVYLFMKLGFQPLFSITLVFILSIPLLFEGFLVFVIINKMTPHLQDGEECTQQSQGGQSSRTRHQADDIFAEFGVSTSSIVHIDWYSSINIVWPSL